MQDGSFGEFRGVPSPDSPEVFATSSGGGPEAGAVDADGNVIVQAEFPGGTFDFMDPWGETGAEMRVLVPHGGHGGPGFVQTIIDAYIERSPYSGPPLFHLSDEAVQLGLLSLYDEPAGQVIGQVAAPYEVTLSEASVTCSPDSYFDVASCSIGDPSVLSDFLDALGGMDFQAPVIGYWARVTAADGQEGWLLIQVRVQGE